MIDPPPRAEPPPDPFTAELARPIGAEPASDGRCTFRVWAPHHRTLTLRLRPRGGPPRDVAMQPGPRGYHRAVLDGVREGDRYTFAADGVERPDPASRWQPDGVHAPSAVIAASCPGEPPPWTGLPLRDWILYELHVGTLTAEGTFDAAIARLDRLVELGVTAVEIMPVAAFPGRRNWGYDGVHLFAAHHAYGGLRGLQRFARACHGHGIAVMLDVVYNHLGPEGNYLSWYGPWFTDAYRTPWGDAINFDGPGSDEVRAHLVKNALFWLEHAELDGLRLDAVHAIYDAAPQSFLEDLSAAVDRLSARLGRPLHLVAESDRNDPRLVTARAAGGHGMAAVWADDLHHALHRRLTGEADGYYRDYGSAHHLADALRDGFAYTGQPSPHRGRRHGRPCAHLPPERFVVCAQNHDQVGNRMRGDRLGHLIPPTRLGLAAVTVLLSPYTPLLFMGEEHADPAPFPYFVDHGDPALIEAVRAGRAAEFAAFQGEGGPPDPAAEATFASAVIDFDRRAASPHREVFALYHALVAERRRRRPERGAVGHAGDRLWWREGDRFVALNFGEAAADFALPPGAWRRVLDTGEARFGGRDGGGPARLEGREDPAVLRLGPGRAAVYRAG